MGFGASKLRTEPFGINLSRIRMMKDVNSYPHKVVVYSNGNGYLLIRDVNVNLEKPL